LVKKFWENFRTKLANKWGNGNKWEIKIYLIKKNIFIDIFLDITDLVSFFDFLAFFFSFLEWDKRIKQIIEFSISHSEISETIVIFINKIKIKCLEFQKKTTLLLKILKFQYDFDADKYLIPKYF
jgi:hypothetical protein